MGGLLHWKTLAFGVGLGLLILSGAIRYPVVVSRGEASESIEPGPGIDEWETWKVNRGSNLAGYLGLVLIVAPVTAGLIEIGVAGMARRRGAGRD